MNISLLTGRLTADPELRYTPSGVAVTKFTLAVDRPFTGTDGKKEADFIPIIVWRKAAEAAANHLRKGQKAAVRGRIQTRNYDGNDGKKVYVTEVIAEEVEFLSPPQNAGQSNGQGQARMGNNEGDNWIPDEDLPF